MLKDMPEDVEGFHLIKHHRYVCDAVQDTQRVEEELIVVVLPKSSVDRGHLGVYFTGVLLSHLLLNGMISQLVCQHK